MTTHRSRLTRRDAEKILDHRGDPTEPLAGLVDAAAATSALATGAEERAVGLFRGATPLIPVPDPEGGSPMTRLTRKLAALPAAGLAAGALVLGGSGLALAANQGAVHVPFTGHDNRSDHAPAAPTSDNPGLSGTAGAPESAENTPSATPSPSLEGLCHAYQAGAMPRSAFNPAFAALSTAAGGAEGVGAYCTDLIGTSHKPAHPTQAAHPTTPPKPSQAATPPIPRPSQAASPTIPPKPSEAVTPTIPPRPEAAH